jgi:hypothetical protein
VEEQRERATQLRQLISLEFEEYPHLFSLQPRTPYDIYISQIQSNAIVNSADQAFDDQLTQETQTEPMGFNDFTNQAPEDYNRTFLM